MSVVVCTYNGARTIAECLAGLDALDYPDYEVIVVDDGSTDDDGGDRREYGCPPDQHAEPRALSRAQHRAGAATGEIVAYIDDDARTRPATG